MEQSSCKMVMQSRDAPSYEIGGKVSDEAKRLKRRMYEHWIPFYYSRYERVLAIIYSSDCHLTELERHWSDTNKAKTSWRRTLELRRISSFLRFARFQVLD